MVELQRLRSFLVVAELGAISEAATHLRVSQPALSRRMQLLEEELGAPLLVRSRKGATLSAMGRMVAAEGRELVGRYDALKARIRAHRRLEDGVVRIGGGATAVSQVLPGAIAEFSRRYPKVVFHLKEAGSADVEAAVLSDAIDLGIVTLPTRSADVAVEPLQRDRIVLIAAVDHPLVQRRVVTAQHLRGQGIVGFEANSAIRGLVDRALQQADIDVHVVMELRSIGAIVEMVSATKHLAFVSELGLPTTGDIRPLAVRGLRIERELAVISRRDRALTPAASAFAGVLRKRGVASTR
ncbi:MAG: LysR family transcriptional regulator [Myxococcales bacterium FL481]|nr:MAG: LysR family transcriptional regulator [Myxococcales bacterium FL481]